MKSNTTPTKRHPDKRKAPVVKIVLAVVIILILAIICGTAAFLKLYKPSVDTDVPFDTKTDKPSDVTTAPDSDTPPEVTTEPSTPSGNFTRDTKSVNFLVVGRDAAGWNTDVIMLVNFNMEKGSLSVMQMPRDTYIVALPGGAPQSRNAGLLRAA